LSYTVEQTIRDQLIESF